MDGTSIEARISSRNDTETVAGFVLPVSTDSEEEETAGIIMATLPPECLDIWYEVESAVRSRDIQSGPGNELLQKMIDLLRD